MNKEDKIEEEFSDLIRNKLNMKDFEEYVFSWIDVDWLCKIMEDWDIKTKEEAIKDIKRDYLK